LATAPSLLFDLQKNLALLHHEGNGFFLTQPKVMLRDAALGEPPHFQLQQKISDLTLQL